MVGEKQSVNWKQDDVTDDKELLTFASHHGHKHQQCTLGHDTVLPEGA